MYKVLLDPGSAYLLLKTEGRKKSLPKGTENTQKEYYCTKRWTWGLYAPGADICTWAHICMHMHEETHIRRVLLLLPIYALKTSAVFYSLRP